MISPQTPTGSFNVTTLLPAIEAGIVSPYILGASSLNHSKNVAAYAASPLASAKGLPFSHVISLARSSEFSTYSRRVSLFFGSDLGMAYHQVIPLSQKLRTLAASPCSK